MSYGLVGPYAFDPKTAQTCGRDALSATGRAIRGGRGQELIEAAATAVDPGLYILIKADDRGGRPEIAGFWVVPDGDYTNTGPLGPPDRVPPFAQALLDAATEEVWWQNLDVYLDKDDVWRPIIVIEWRPVFASRSALPPPGIPFEDVEAREFDAEDRETWLEAVDPNLRRVQSDIPTMSYDKELDRFGHIRPERSLIVVVRGTLRHDGRLHTGSFFMVPPELLDDGTPDALPVDAWLAATQPLTEADFKAVEHEEDDRHHLGKALMLPGDRVGFHASGWLTRNLAVWPARPGDITIGALTDRVVQQKWIAQGWLALTSSAVVLASVLSFSAAVVLLTRPVPEPMDPPPPPAAQPALSVCSADYQEFVDEFRCQIAHLSYRPDDGGTVPICRDAGSSSRWTDRGDDLQPEYCGLLDREIDGWTADLRRGDRANFAWFAASQACFNVLGHPFPYRLREITDAAPDADVPAAAGTGRVVGSPFSFLQHEELGIQPLMDLVGELQDACDAYRDRSEARVEGAVFATHVGSTMSELPTGESGGSALRRSALAAAMVGVGADAQVCFRRGIGEGREVFRFEGMCSETPDRLDNKMDQSKIWRKLSGALPDSGPTSVIDRYSAARFAAPGTKVGELWSCHLALASTAELVGDPRGRWDVPIPIPQSYDVTGAGVQTQLALDAAIRSFREDGRDSGICWKVVARRLSNYTPVHPLLADLAPDGWPSEEQQLCGQICAARFNIRRSINDSGWVTRDEDLAQCLLREPGPANDSGAGSLDRLRLPWNEVRRGEWVEPNAAEICAFNVIAQDLMPPLEKGYVVQERAPKEFAGETFSGSRIVGGEEGLAARYVQGLAFGRMDSVTSSAACGHVATQCFAGLMLEVTGTKDIERYRWLDQWRRRIEDLTQLKRSELAETHPWCVGVKEYLIPERETAQFDTPCVAGVAEARKNAEAALGLLEAQGAAAGGTQ